MNKEQLAEQYAREYNNTPEMAVNIYPTKRHFLAGYDAAIHELQAENTLYSDSEAFRVGYAQALKELGWRKVEDELPIVDEKSGFSKDVLVFYDNTKAIAYYSQTAGWIFYDDICTWKIQVTHWMPIPSIND